MLFLGIVTLGLVFGISSLSKTQFYNPFFIAPLGFKGLLTAGAESFAALRAATSPVGQFFVTVITAATIEEIVLGFAFVLMGSFILGFGLRKIFNLDFGDMGNDVWDFIMAMIFSVILFSSLHIFNGTYINPNGTLNWNLFLFAAMFRLVLNVIIYVFDFGICYSIGVHAVNNALFLGGATVLSALISPVGVIIDAILIIFVVFAIMSFRVLAEEGKIVFIKLFHPSI